VSAATRPGDDGAVTPAQVLAGLLLAIIVLWLLAPFAGVDPPKGLTASNAPWTDEGFNLANARERVLSGQFATGDIDRSLTNGAYSALAAAMFAVTGPSLAAGRVLSMVAVAAAVMVLALGLARPLGRPAALLAAAALGGANLMLEHGRLALVEATVVALLAGAFVLATRAAWRPSRAAGAGLGLLIAAAVSVKANALLPGLAGLAALVVAGGAWLAAVALPNWDRFRTSLRIWPTVEYLDGPAAIAGRLGRYLADSDQALGRSLPLLLAAALGVAALARRWPRLAPEARDALVMALLWGTGLWLAVAVADYLPGHYGAPNRYVVPALPGLAVLAGFGLADLAALVGRGRAGDRSGGTGRLAAVAGIALGLAVALPGVVTYLDGALDSGRSREQGQRALSASLPTSAVVYGAYAPTMLFDTQLVTRTPWPTAEANVRDPVGSLGVTHVLVGAEPADPTGQVPTLAVRGAGESLARVPWGPGELVLYGLPATSGFGVSPLAAPIDYHPLAGPSRRM
jgi:hypothetical protein